MAMHNQKIRPQQALKVLGEFGEMTYSQYANEMMERFGAKLRTATEMISDLYNDGYLEKRQSTEDARLWIYSLSEKGLKAKDSFRDSRAGVHYVKRRRRAAKQNKTYFQVIMERCGAVVDAGGNFIGMMEPKPATVVIDGFRPALAFATEPNPYDEYVASIRQYEYSPPEPRERYDFPRVPDTPPEAAAERRRENNQRMNDLVKTKAQLEQERLEMVNKFFGIDIRNEPDFGKKHDWVPPWPH